MGNLFSFLMGMMGNLFSRNTRSSRGHEHLVSSLAATSGSRSTSNVTFPNLNRDPNNVSEKFSLCRSTEIIFQQFYSKLVETLPMDDPNFTAELYSARLLPSHLKEYVESRSPATRTVKATHFLDQVIKLSMTSFDKLLRVMEDSEYQHVKELAAEILRTSLRNTSSSNNGNYHTDSLRNVVLWSY